MIDMRRYIDALANFLVSALVAGLLFTVLWLFMAAF